MNLYRKMMHKKSDVILSIYICFIIVAHIFVSWQGNISIFFFLIFMAVLVGSVYICPLVLNSGEDRKSVV